MRLVFGLSSLALGTVVAAGYLYNGYPQMRAHVPIGMIDDIGAGTARTFSPEGAPFAAIAASNGKSEAIAAPPAGAVQDQATWRTQTTGTVTAGNEARQFDGRLTSMQPGDGEARRQLVRNLQAELKRVGCYLGSVSGEWSAPTQAAMSELLTHSNAVLPVNEPDYILLKMVQGQKPGACAVTPAVVPAVVAAEQPAPPVENPPGSVTAESQTGPPADAAQDLPPGRMAVGGPQTEPVAEPEPLVASEVPSLPRKPARRFRVKTRPVSELFQHPLGH